jgi:hypothetical protein
MFAIRSRDILPAPTRHSTPSLLPLERHRFFDDLREELFLDDFVVPFFARVLLTVAAAMDLARRVLRPRFSALSLMCSYCRSSFFDQFLVPPRAFAMEPPSG